MSISLMPLPYARDALAPAISADTLDTHHGKHHKAYVDKTNAAIADGPLANASLEEIVARSRGGKQGLFNNAAQTWNHGFYWASLSPRSSQPSGDLAAAIERFGGQDKLIEELSTRGANHFASGWVWLAGDNGKLTVIETHDADTLADQGPVPLLVIDLWEHAYYLDHKNVRPDYLKAVLNDLLNWDFAGENLARSSRWTYPA
ncbi:MAG TPA: superoxide dismutase [Novosphingobium sp.]|nr:superoxide dismutase [Novosphingobium sp.]